MLTGPELGAAIEAAVVKKGITKKKLAEDFGVKPPSVQGWVKNGRIDKAKLFDLMQYFSDVVDSSHWGISPSAAVVLYSAERERADTPLNDQEAALRNAVVHGLPTSSAGAVGKVLEMLAKHGKTLNSSAQERLLQAVEDSLEEASSGTVIHADFSRRPAKDDEIRIAHYDVKSAMGAGQIAPDYPEMFEDVIVSQQHLRELGVTYNDPNHLKMMTGVGQSMEPTIRHLDPLIVDVSIREFVGDGIYAFWWQGHFYTKRLQVADADHFEMISDNPRHKDRLIRMDETYIQCRILLVWNAKKV